VTLEYHETDTWQRWPPPVAAHHQRSTGRLLPHCSAAVRHLQNLPFGAAGDHQLPHEGGGFFLANYADTTVISSVLPHGDWTDDHVANKRTITSAVHYNYAVQSRPSHTLIRVHLGSARKYLGGEG